MKKVLCYLTLLFCIGITSAQNVGINATGATPNVNAMLDLASTTSGLLIPRMTTAQRDAITTPPNGLQVFNITTNSVDIYLNTAWKSVAMNTASNLVIVYSLADLPTPSGSAITLDATKIYLFSGIVDISPYYLDLNGAGLRGTDPSKDAVMSNVSGAVLRSTGVSVFMQNISILPASGATQAYDFADATGTMFCTLFPGCGVREIGIPSLGVGQISGFVIVSILQNFWVCADGLKVSGSLGLFVMTSNYIAGITAGAGLEFLAGTTADQIDLSNNYFDYVGQTGIVVGAGAAIGLGRMTTNMFGEVGTSLSGFDSYTPEWSMSQNTGIPNSRAICFQYMNTNSTVTSLPTLSTFAKIAGTTSTVNQHRFTSSSNRMTYIGKDLITARILTIIGAKSPASNADYSIAIAKNGVVVSNPNGSMAAATNNESFQITLATEVDLGENDYIEVWVRRNNSNTINILVEELQFRVTN